MFVSLLGPAELHDESGIAISVASRRQRQLLVALGLNNGKTISTDRLIDWLWGDALPADPVATLQTNVSRLRRLLDDTVVLSTETGGYRLTVGPDDLDIVVFEKLISEGRSLPSAELVNRTERALALWRGVPFSDLDNPTVAAERARFEAMRLDVSEMRLDALGVLGRHDEVVALAEPLVLAHPTRERVVARLMTSLYASGRQSDSLDCYNRLRQELVEQLGIDPSPELQKLEVEILQQRLALPDIDAGEQAMEPPVPISDPPVHSPPADDRLSQHIRFCVTDDGVRLAYATSGVGPPLVRAANWMTHLDYDWDNPVWRHWLRGLSSQHRLIRYDERGCGLSDWNVDVFSFSDWVADLEAVVDQLELERFPLLGVSQGAAVAIAYAARHPDRVSQLILFGGYARGRLSRATTDEMRAEAAMHVDLARIGWGTDDPAFRQVFTSHFLPDGSRELWDEFNELQRRTTSPKNAARFMEVFGEIDVAALAPQVQCPTLVVHSRDELRVPASSSTELASLIPDSQLCLLPSRNHLLLEDEPAWGLFLEEINRFLV